jgi:rod shape determining protein RodA
MRSFSNPISRIAPLQLPQLPEERSLLRSLGNVHWGLLLAALGLYVAGVMTIKSATSELGNEYFNRQLMWGVVGLVVLSVVFAIDYRRLIDLSPIFYVITLGALVMILIFGHTAGGAKSWVGIGGFGGQPSEMAKLLMSLILARYLAGIDKAYLDLREILTATGLTAIPMSLVIAERDLGGAAMFLAILGAMLLVAGIRPRVIIVVAALGLMIALGAWKWALHDYQKARIVSFVSPEADPLGSGYQVRQSKIAVGSGQWIGRGYGQGTQSQLRFLPERHTDFIMAVLAEEWGFLGVLAVFGLYLTYFGTAAKIAMRSRDRVGILLVTGLVAVQAVHVIYNTAMVVGLLPITGVPLPFLSYGGSFSMINFMALGLVLNVDFRRYVNR